MISYGTPDKMLFPVGGLKLLIKVWMLDEIYVIKIFHIQMGVNYKLLFDAIVFSVFPRGLVRVKA